MKYIDGSKVHKNQFDIDDSRMMQRHGFIYAYKGSISYREGYAAEAILIEDPSDPHTYSYTFHIIRYAMIQLGKVFLYLRQPTPLVNPNTNRAKLAAFVKLGSFKPQETIGVLRRTIDEARDDLVKDLDAMAWSVTRGEKVSNRDLDIIKTVSWDSLY